MKNPTLMKSFFAALTALAFAVPCSAATLAFYDIESNTTTAAQSSGTGLTASAIDVTGAGGTSGLASFQGSSMPYWFSDNVNDDANIDASVTPIVGGSPGTGDILGTFSLTPDAGQQISLGTTDVFDIGVLAYQVSGSYTATARLFVASDATFTTILATSTTITNNRESAGGATVTSSTAGSGNGVGEVVGLLGLDNAVTSSSTLYFGIAMVDNDNTGDFNARFDGVGVYGTVSPIPEPSAGLLVVFATAALFLRRRRA